MHRILIISKESVLSIKFINNIKTKFLISGFLSKMGEGCDTLFYFEKSKQYGRVVWNNDSISDSYEEEDAVSRYDDYQVSPAVKRQPAFRVGELRYDLS